MLDKLNKNNPEVKKVLYQSIDKVLEILDKSGKSITDFFGKYNIGQSYASLILHKKRTIPLTVLLQIAKDYNLQLKDFADFSWMKNDSLQECEPLMLSSDSIRVRVKGRVVHSMIQMIDEKTELFVSQTVVQFFQLQENPKLKDGDERFCALEVIGGDLEGYNISDGQILLIDRLYSQEPERCGGGNLLIVNEGGKYYLARASQPDNLPENLLVLNFISREPKEPTVPLKSNMNVYGRVIRGIYINEY